MLLNPSDDVNTPIIIDVEASGFGVGSYPIEVGFVLPDGSPNCFLIAPLEEWVHWDQGAEKIHGIQRQTIVSHGRPIQEIAQLLNEQLADTIVYSDAWGNDSSWLGLLFHSAGVAQQFRLESIRALLNERQIERWHETRNEVQLELGLERHRASSDARVLQQTYLRTLECLNA